MEMRQHTGAAVSIFALLAVTACGGDSEDSEAGSVTIRVNHEDGSGSPSAEAVEWFAEQVENETETDVESICFHDGHIAAEQEADGLLEQGGLEMAMSGAQIISALAPEYGAMLVPYAFEDEEHVAAVLNGEVGESLADEILEDHD